MNKKNNYKKYVFAIWASLFLTIASIVGVFVSASLGVFGLMPDFRQLENPDTKLATQIISSDNIVIGKYYFNDNRTPIDFEEIPKQMVEALIATEDERFYNHSGIDFKGTARALIYLGKKGGASTITQQLARQLFTGVRSRNTLQAIIQKVKEWVIAVRLERRYTKNEIIAMYLNIYDFNYNADGLKSASSIYFSKNPEELDLDESAMLIGMLKNSSLYNPIRRPELVKKRRNIVFQQMERNNLISNFERDSLSSLPIKLDFNPQSHREGIATYFRSHLQKYVSNWIKKNPKEDGSSYNLYLDGLRVYTTIDSRLQNYAEQAVTSHMKNLQREFFNQNRIEQNPTAPFLDITDAEIEKIIDLAMRRSERWRKMKKRGIDEDSIYTSFNRPAQMEVFSWNGDIDTLMTPKDSIYYYKHFLRSGMMSVEPQTGHVKAWVGGINYRHFQFDHVKQGKRQIGSTFKPFVYATAIDQLKVSPCDSLPDGYYCVEPGKFGGQDPWCPKNSGDRYIGKRTLKNALANSVNTISARLIDRVGPRPVANLAKDLGVSSQIPNVPAIALGSPDLSVYEMVGAYSSFANKGIYIKPEIITRIEDKNGTTIFQPTPITKDVISEESAYVTLKLLEGVTEAGSGIRLRHRGADEYNRIFKDVVTGYPYEFTNPIAGKTGTTQNQSDGWFIGMVPNLVTGVWVGGEDRSVHFESIAFGQGATMALPIWGSYMKQIYADSTISVSSGPFEAPIDVSIPIDCDSLSIELKKKSFFEKDGLNELGL